MARKFDISEISNILIFLHKTPLVSCQTILNFSFILVQTECLKMPMALSTQEAADDDQFVLLAKIDSARSVSNILKAIHFKEVTRFITSPPF